MSWLQHTSGPSCLLHVKKQAPLQVPLPKDCSLPTSPTVIMLQVKKDYKWNWYCITQDFTCGKRPTFSNSHLSGPKYKNPDGKPEHKLLIFIWPFASCVTLNITYQLRVSVSLTVRRIKRDCVSLSFSFIQIGKHTWAGMLFFPSLASVSPSIKWVCLAAT